MMLRIDIQRLGAIYYHILLCLLRFLLCPPNEVSGDILCLLRFLLSPQTKFGDLLFLHRFLLSSQTKFGNLLFLHRFFLLLLLLLFLFFFFSLWACPTKFSETNDPIFTKLHRKVDPHLKRCIQSWNFQNGRRCHGNRERMSKSSTSLISETAKGISTKLGINIKEGW